MTFQLPDYRPFNQKGRHENGWSDHYGALQVAADYGGLVLAPHHALQGIWQHGVFGPWQHFSPDMLVYNAPAARQQPVFVARQDQADLLQASGYLQVQAIGLPIVYVPDPDVERLPRSLLVVPTHSLWGDTHADRRPFERYANSIKALRGEFDSITVCIHPNCRRNGHWVKEFTVPGISIVYGADTGDANALLRMRRIFARFESVTTNEWGSHVAYALAFGARVSIAGQTIHGDPALHRRDEMWKNHPAALAQAFSPEVAARRGEFLKKLYVGPTAGVTDVAWGRWFVGAEHQLSSEEMGALLARLLTPAPRPVRIASDARVRRVLFVSHEASRTGAPMFLLHFLRWLNRHTDQSFDLLLAKGGPLQDEFAQLATVVEPKAFTDNPELIRTYDLIYSNTACNGNLLEEIGCGEIPVITHVHELDMGYHWLGPRNMAGVVRQSSHYVACAQAVADRLRTVFNIPAARLSVHYEMIDPAVVAAHAAASDAAQLRQVYDLPPNAFIVTGCGTFDSRKAPDLFVQLAARLKRELGPDRPLRFLWIGAQNTPDLVTLVREDARKLGLEAELRLIAELPSPHGLIALSDLFCLTSREDPFPLVMLEAALLEKPVLCFAGAGGAGEFCAAGGGVAVPYLDVPAMAGLAGELLRDPVRRGEIGRRAAAVVRERFTAEVVAPALWREVQHHLEQALPPPVQRSAQVPLADIFREWHPTQAPQPAFIAAHLARDAVRRAARQLVSQGRRKDAVQLLVKAVSADLATKNAWIICEGLVEIAHELASIDSRQAQALLDKARQVADSTGIRLQQYQPRATVAPVAA